MKKPIDELIQNLQKQRKKILTLDKLRKLINKSYGENTPINKIYKITFQLKNRGFLYPIRKELFYISNPEKKITNEEIEEQLYRKLLKEHCNKTSKYRYIGGLTSLEIHLHGNGITIPETITIINKDKQAIETLMFEKTIAFKKYETKGKNLINILIKQTNEVSILNCKNIRIANLELSILECLYNFDTTNRGYIEECIKKAIKKNGKTLNLEYLETIIKQGKHNTSLNRLYTLTKQIYPNLSNEIKKIIIKYGFIL